MTRTQVYCKDCKHYEQWTRGTIHRLEVHECHKNPPIYDLVKGKPEYRLAYSERAIVNEPNHCGREGKWFEPKITEDADLDDLSTIPFGR